MKPQSKPRHTLTKEERLYAQKRIETLFSKGNSFIAYPLRVVFVARDNDIVCKESPLISILVSVSKKRFKRAVKRNRTKRIIKEAYRLNKQGFANIANSSNKSFDIAFLYLKEELPDYAEVEKAILKSISILQDKTKKEDENNP